MTTKPLGKVKSKVLIKGKSFLLSYGFPLIMALVALIILAGGYAFYHSQEQQMRQRTESGLLLVAKSKADQIAEWRSARLIDANTLAGSPSFTEIVADYLASPTDIDTRDKVLGDLAIVAQSYPYQDVLLVDVNGNILLHTNDSVTSLNNTIVEQIPIAVEKHQAVFTDFHLLSGTASPHLDVIAPIYPWRQDSAEAIGAIILSIDPSRYLYPLLQSFPIPSQTGEALLVERDGDQALFLNELRHQQDTALKLRIPLTQQDVPAVMAVLGKEGVFQGTDYRGMPVLSATQHIPDSPWYLVAKIDSSEALAAWRTRGGLIVALSALALVAVQTSIGMEWQRRRRRTYQKLYQAEMELHESEEKFRSVFDNNADAMFLTTPDGGIIEANPAACRIFGYTEEEFRRYGRNGIIDSSDPSLNTALEQRRCTGLFKGELNFKRKDGTRFAGEISSVVFKDKDGRDRTSMVVRDITERKQSEGLLRESEERYRALFDRSLDCVYLHDLEGNFLDSNDKALELLGYDRKDIPHLNFASLLSEDQLHRAFAALEEVIETGTQRQAYEFRLKRKDGGFVYVETTESAIYRDGEIQAIQGIARDLTERKQAEQALRDSEERYRALVQQSLVGIGMSIGNKITFANSALLSIFGYDNLEEFAVKPLIDYLTPSSREFIAERMSKIARGENVEDNFELSIIRKDREVRTLNATSSHLTMGGEIYAHTVFQDVTEHNRAQETVKAERAKLQALVDGLAGTQVGIDIVGLDYKVRFQNQILEERFGDLTGKLCYENYMGRDKPCDPCPMEQAIKANRPQSIELSGADGRYYKLLSAPLPNPDGTVDEAIEVVIDITEQKMAGEALRQSEERYRTILEGMDESYYEVDLAGNFTFVNDSLCRRLGHSREKLIGMNYRAYTPREVTDDTFKTFNRVYRTGKPVKGVPSAAIAGDGSLIFTERSVFPLLDKEGKIVGFRGISRDVTERRMAEEEKRQLELKAQISSRLASVGEMAAGVAHEINNPLTAVTGYAQLLVNREDIPPDVRSDLEAINDGAQRVAGIVQRLLAFSRQTKPQRKFVDINELIESTLILRAYQLRVNNIEVITRLYPDLLETVVDPGQIQQVLLNLIVNAETEMKLDRGNGRLTITTEKNDNTIKICVKDNGPGIKSDIIDRIFDPFFTTKETGQGTGLGLSLCYGIITEHQGKIYVESKPGKGATFIIELPVVREFISPEQAKLQFEPAKAINARILVVDDEQVIRDIVSRVLTGEEHRVEAVDNAADALKKIESKKYDLILVDIKMPGMNGIELFKRIRKIDKSLAGKVVFITGDIMSADTEKFLSKTKVSHISKPFDADQLKTEITRALTRN